MAAKKKTTTKKKSKKPSIDIDEELTVEKLLERGRVMDAERQERAAVEAKKPHEVRAPVASRPCAPVEWSYSWWFDEKIPADRRETLTAFFSKFTKVADERGFLVVAPDTDPERRRSAWDAGANVVELDQVEAQLPPTAEGPRLEALARSRDWWDLVMLLSTWDPSTLPNAIAAAERTAARWPDELRTMPDHWKERADLRPLVRTAWGDIAEAAQRADLENVRVLKTQDVDSLRENAARFAHVTALDLSGKAGLGDAIVEMHALENLEVLSLQQPTYSGGTGAIDLAKLLSAPHLQKLQKLSLYGYTLTAADLDALASCNQPLRFLRIQYAGMKPPLAKQLAKLASRRKLQRLDLKYNDLGPKGAQTLFANGGDWSALEVLDFSANEIGDRGTAAIVNADVRSLRWLNLSSNDNKEQLSEKGAQTIADSKALGALETLIVYGHPVKEKGVAALATSSNLSSLRALCTAFPGCSLDAIVDATKGEGAAKIEELHLGNTDNAKKRKTKPDWSRMKFLSSVRVLNLDSLPGAQYEGFFSCPHLGSLEILALGNAYYDPEAAAEVLATTPAPPKLRYLELNGWKPTPDQAKRFADSPIGRQLWGCTMMPSYVPPESWRVFYDAGLPLVGIATFTCDPASEHRSWTMFREDTVPDRGPPAAGL